MPSISTVLRTSLGDAPMDAYSPSMRRFLRADTAKIGPIMAATSKRSSTRTTTPTTMFSGELKRPRASPTIVPEREPRSADETEIPIPGSVIIDIRSSERQLRCAERPSSESRVESVMPIARDRSS